MKYNTTLNNLHIFFCIHYFITTADHCFGFNVHDVREWLIMEILIGNRGYLFIIHLTLSQYDQVSGDNKFWAKSVI